MDFDAREMYKLATGPIGPHVPDYMDEILKAARRGKLETTLSFKSQEARASAIKYLHYRGYVTVFIATTSRAKLEVSWR